MKNGPKQGGGMAPVLFILTLELSLTTDSSVLCRSVRVVGCADDINILDRSRMAVNGVYTALENQEKL
jgi:hypothetical protein